MPGDTWYVQGGPQVETLVRAAGTVVEHAGVRVALIGGLAVSARLGIAHRMTTDIDLVADAPTLVSSGDAADNLVAAGVAVRDRGATVQRVFIDGTKVELIETFAIDPREAADIEPAAARHFVLAHRWALDTASSLRIAIVGSHHAADIPVAVPAALVAMKLGAVGERHEERKRASDAWDLYRLLSRHASEASFAAHLATAPPELTALMVTTLDRVFRAEVTTTRRWIRAFGAREWFTQASEATLAAAADGFDAALREATS